jgi:hypothetical protein
MQFKDDPAKWTSALSDQQAQARLTVQALEQLCNPSREDLCSTMRMALALMAIRDAQIQQARAGCDFSDLLGGSPATRPAAPPTP